MVAWLGRCSSAWGSRAYFSTPGHALACKAEGATCSPHHQALLGTHTWVKGSVLGVSTAAATVAPTTTNLRAWEARQP